MDWTGPCGTTQRGGLNKNYDHFYVTLEDKASLGIRITWPDSTDEFDVIVYRGWIAPELRIQDAEEDELGRDQLSGSWLLQPLEGGIKRFLFADLDRGDYTVRVIYRSVVEGYYEGRVWSTPPDSELIPDPESGPAERRSYTDSPNDDFFDAQWSLEKIQAPAAWKEPRATGHGITIGVVDYGVDPQHPDLTCPGKLLVIPGAKIGESEGPWDENGHGTHVAGIAAACTDNREGVAGVAPDATIMPVQVNHAIETALLPGDADAAMAEGIRFATHNGAHVINLSIGPLPPSGYMPESHPATKAALQEARAAGVVVTAAAGNNSSPACEFPSLSRFVICVGATDRQDQKTYYSDAPVNVEIDPSDPGPHPAIMAPGGENRACHGPAGENVGNGILSTYLTTEGDPNCDWPEGYMELSGTSMASPFVAGVAALVYDRLGGERTLENADKVVKAILETADPLYAPGWDPILGHGRVNALEAVRSVKLPEEEEGGQVDPSPTPTQSTEPSPEPFPSSTDTGEPSPDPSPSSSDPGEPSPDPSPSSSDPGEPSPEPSPSSSDAGSPTAHQVTLSPRDVKGAVGTESTLTVTVVDAGGEPLSGIPVEWASVGVGELPAVEESTDAAGRAVATLVSDEPGDQGVMVWTDSCDAEGRCWDTATRHHGPEVCDVFGTRGDDVLKGSAASEVICAFGGDDLVVARAGDDRLIGGSGDDDLRGGAGNDRLKGGKGGDLLIGGRGRDVMAGGAGKDVCWGSSGDRSTSCRS